MSRPMKLDRRILAALLFSGIVAVDAQADPVQITTGFLTSSGAFGIGHFEWSGEGFSAAGAAEPGVIGPAFCFPCTSGDLISLDTFYSGTIGGGTATVGGTTYEDVTFGGEVSFSAPDVTAPSAPGGFTTMQPFTFNANLIGFLDYNTSAERIAFTQMLTGHGIVTASFSATPGQSTPIFSFQTVRYDFASDAAVPEPATLLLFGSGLAAAVIRKKFRT